MIASPREKLLVSECEVRARYKQIQRSVLSFRCATRSTALNSRRCVSSWLGILSSSTEQRIATAVTCVMRLLHETSALLPLGQRSQESRLSRAQSIPVVDKSRPPPNFWPQPCDRASQDCFPLAFRIAIFRIQRGVCQSILRTDFHRLFALLYWKLA